MIALSTLNAAKIEFTHANWMQKCTCMCCSFPLYSFNRCTCGIRPIKHLFRFRKSCGHKNWHSSIVKLLPQVCAFSFGSHKRLHRRAIELKSPVMIHPLRRKQEYQRIVASNRRVSRCFQVGGRCNLKADGGARKRISSGGKRAVPWWMVGGLQGAAGGLGSVSQQDYRAGFYDRCRGKIKSQQSQVLAWFLLLMYVSTRQLSHDKQSKWFISDFFLFVIWIPRLPGRI